MTPKPSSQCHAVSAPADPAPIAIDGQLANFTLLVLTYKERLPLLYKFVWHYSHCASVSEVLIIWNMGKVRVPLDGNGCTSTCKTCDVRCEWVFVKS